MRATRAAAAALLALAACGGASTDVPADPTLYGGDRPVRLRLPESIAPGRTYPLLLVLHGYGATGALQSLYLQLSPEAFPGGAFVLAPDGTVDALGNRFWHASDVCCGVGVAPPDDVVYLGGLLDAVRADWPVDRSRVLVAGHSNGAFMAYRLACDRADVVTAIAGLAGAATSLDGSGCAPSAPVSVLHLHGTADGTVAYAGGTFPYGGTYPGAGESVAQWADHDGCAATWAEGAALDLDSALPGAETATRAADGCPPGVAVELWSIEGAGHVPALVPGFGATAAAWLAGHPRAP